MREISQAADLALATVYRYFPSKELLLARVFEQWCEGYWTRLARAADGRANIDRLIDLASRSVEAYVSQPNILMMISELQLSKDPGRCGGDGRHQTTRRTILSRRARGTRCG